MSGPRYPKVSFNSNQEIVETPKAPHHSFVCFEYQSNTKISLPPLESHDPIVMHERNHTQWELLLSVSCLSFSCLLVCHDQKSVHVCRLHTVWCMTMICPQNAYLMLLFFSFLWIFLNSEHVGIHYYIFLVWWFTHLYFLYTTSSPTWVNQCADG